MAAGPQNRSSTRAGVAIRLVSPVHARITMRHRMLAVAMLLQLASAPCWAAGINAFWSECGQGPSMRSFACNILKANQIDTLSQDRYRAALAGIKNLLRMLAIP